MRLEPEDERDQKVAHQQLCQHEALHAFHQAPWHNTSATRAAQRKADLEPALRRLVDAPGPALLDVQVPYQEHVLPMIPSGMTVKDLIRK